LLKYLKLVFSLYSTLFTFKSKNLAQLKKLRNLSIVSFRRAPGRDITPDEVLDLDRPTREFLCPLSANTFGIAFLSFTIGIFVSVCLSMPENNLYGKRHLRQHHSDFGPFHTPMIHHHHYQKHHQQQAPPTFPPAGFVFTFVFSVVANLPFPVPFFKPTEDYTSKHLIFEVSKDRPLKFDINSYNPNDPDSMRKIK
jgi:hypothetical protein